MQFQEKLKAIYKRQDKIAPLIEGLEGEIPEQTLDDYYVKLNTIIKEDTDKKQANYEAISGQKKEVEIEDIFDQTLSEDIPSKASTRRLLILGGAGVGKSTLMQYIAYRWATNGLWKEKFDYVYRVTLKILLNTGWDRDYTKDERKDELKCLIHYNLAAQEEDYRLEEMPWLEKKDKILLLLDGYDEVAHERNGAYKKLFEKIFEHENIILTSRPNAIDKQMTEKFGRKIENTGLDHNGINKYLTQYFKNDQEKGTALEEFLEKNSSIKEICRIPVNIAMMCFIWSEGGSNEALHEISNMSDLYKQVVDHLGFRFYAKMQSSDQNIDDLMSKWRGGEIYLDELQVLEYTAYKGMTGGGFEVPNDKRLQTLIIKGMTKKGDRDGTSIQSSINYLRDKLKKDMPTINKVYKYGLLKPEGIILTDNKKLNHKKEPSETDLQEQSFSFIHLSFQEFLTALYLVQHLFQEEQEMIANFIAQHRNEPRYLMTLKLMAGILSSNDEKQAEQGIKIFWDAVLCNPDGVLELGVEAKVTLLMHLLGQAKRQDSLDRRIPNVDMVVNFVDSVILQDLAGWSGQLKESDFLSEKTKQRLIQHLEAGMEAVIDIISSMINKFSQEEQDQILKKFIKLIHNSNEENWRFKKDVFEATLTIHQKAQLTLDMHQEKELLDSLLITVYDANLEKLSLKMMQELLDISKKPALIEKVKIYVKQENSRDVDIVAKCARACTKIHLLKVCENLDRQFVTNAINTLAPLLQDDVTKILALKTITDIVKISCSTDTQLLRDSINLLFSHFSDLRVMPSDRVSGHIQELMNLIANDEEFISSLRLKLQDSDISVRVSASYQISQLAMATRKVDIQLVKDLLNNFLSVPQDANSEKERRKSKTSVYDIIRASLKNDIQLPRDILGLLIPLFQHPTLDVRNFAFGNISTLAISSTDIQLNRDIINLLIPFFNSYQ